MNKKAQITIFIIIALVIIVGVGIYFAVSGNLDKVKGSSLNTRQIQGFVESCIEEVGEDVIYFVGQQGGYSVVPKVSTDFGIPYYFYDGKSYVPTKEQIEEQISLYVNEFLPLCINNFESFKDFEINSNKINTKTFLRSNKILIEVNYPLTIIKGESSLQIRDFSIEVSSRLAFIQEIAEKIIEEQIKTPESICLSCLLNLELVDGLSFGMINEEDDIIFTIIDTEYLLKEEYYNFNFALRLEQNE